MDEKVLTVKDLNGINVTLEKVAEDIVNVFIDRINNTQATELINFLSGVNFNQVIEPKELLELLAEGYKNTLVELLNSKDKRITLNSIEDNIVDLWLDDYMVNSHTFKE